MFFIRELYALHTTGFPFGAFPIDLRQTPGRARTCCSFGRDRADGQLRLGMDVADAVAAVGASKSTFPLSGGKETLYTWFDYVNYRDSTARRAEGLSAVATARKFVIRLRRFNHLIPPSNQKSDEESGPKPRPSDQTAYALNLTSPFSKSMVPGAQIWIGFTQEYSAAEVVSVMFNRS